MFVVEDILISDDIATAQFDCDLTKCLGACCVNGDEGAPLAPDERRHLDAVLPKVRFMLRPEALAVIGEEGTWEETAPGRYATTCVNNAECVFVIYDRRIAKCAIQKAYFDGLVDWPKPVSCHLFPIRVHQYGGHEVLNYEQWGLCHSARKNGEAQGRYLHDALAEPLTRKYGAAWYAAFQKACTERCQELLP